MNTKNNEFTITTSRLARSLMGKVRADCRS